MLKFVLVLLGLLLITNANEFRTLSLSNGKAIMNTPRLLEEQVPHYSLDSHRKTNSGVRVNLGEAFQTANSLPQATPTSMLVFLYTNVSGFCADCGEFTDYTCKKEYCKSVYPRSNLNMEGPYYAVTKGIAVNHAISIGDGSVWQLKTPAIMYTYDNRVSRSVSSGFPYVSEKDAYGFIGLGVCGDASKNFKTGESQIFSINMTATGEGHIIFGKNESLYNDTVLPQTIATDGNWTSKGVSMSLGTDDTIDFKTSVIFDLQHPGIAIPLSAFNAVGGVWKKFTEKYSISLGRSGPSDGYVYIYNGNIGDLEPFIVTLEKGGKIIVPASGYTEKIEENKYKVLITPVESAANHSVAKMSNEFIVLGRSVLSQFYTVFENNVNNEPSIKLYIPPGDAHLDFVSRFGVLNPDKPVDPVNPDKPVDPVNPDKPVDPVNPDKPVDPVNPDKPVDPVDPSKEDPVKPTGANHALYIIGGAIVVALLMAALGVAFLKPDGQSQVIDTSYKTLNDEERATYMVSSATLQSGTQL